MKSVFVSDNAFDIFDYVVFGLMLGVSILIGVYYGMGYGRRKPPPPQHVDEDEKLKTDEYLTGHRSLSPVPVAMSLVASYVSGVTVLGTPAEVYSFGTQYWLIFVSIWCMGLVVTSVYLPVFVNNRCKSAYEYLELRFDVSVRTFISCMFIFDEILFLPIVVYVPSLAFNQVTGVNIFYVSLVVCVVCVFYTTIGGLHAVVWTDTWQVLVMVISELLIVLLGTEAIGGYPELWKRAEKGGRLIFFNQSNILFERQSFWGVLFGGFFYWTAYNAANQTMVQRYLALPNLRKTRETMLYFTFGVSAFVCLCCFSGLIVYARFWHCDPLTAGFIKANDQLLPLFVMQILGHIPGMMGVFIAAVFGAGLSSMSVVLNSAAAVILEDILKGACKYEFSDKTQVFIVRFTTIILGVWTFIGMNIVQHMGGVLGVVTALTSIAAGTSCGVFTLGMLFPCANSKGAIVGGLAGALLTTWIALGSRICIMMGIIADRKLPVSVEECVGNVTLVESHYPDQSNVFPLYRLSFHWITPIGLFIVISVGLVVSLCTRDKKAKPVHPDFLSPVIHGFLAPEVLEAARRVPSGRSLLQTR